MSTPRRVSNPPNPYDSHSTEWLGEPPAMGLEVYEEEVKSIVAENDSPDIGFRYSINPYRGCFHGCAYCYARPTHNYIGFGAGTDFERKIVAKVNAATKLREAFMRRSWQGDHLVFSGVTDCYQPLEASYRLTRKCLEVCAEFKNPVSLITKSALVQRDIDLFQRLHEQASVQVFQSITFVDDAMAREIEPFTPSPSARFRAMKALSDAGIPVAVAVAPVIPGLNDSQIPAILERAHACGARKAFMTLLRLPLSVKDVFIERLKASFPDRASKVLNRLRDMKDGALNRSEFGTRMHGEGPEWDAISWLFRHTCEQLGMNQTSAPRAGTFRRPRPQLSLFTEPN